MASALSNQDKKTICEATRFVKLEKKSVKDSIEEFADKGSFGLWLDANGFWNVTDQKTVLDIMENYREINDDILAVMQSIEDKEGNANLRILDLYEKLKKFERDADIHVRGKSKALCRLAKKFLNNHLKVNHQLKKVECVVLQRDVNKLEEDTGDLKRNLDQAITSVKTLEEDNQNLKISVDELHKENLNLKNSVDMLHIENLELKTTMETLLKENEALKDMISEANERANQRLKEANERADQRLKEANEAADQRLKDANERADQRLTEMVEETKRNMQKMVIEMRKAESK